MLVDPRKLLVVVFVIAAIAAAAVTAPSFDARAAMRSLPSFGGDEPYDVDVSAFSPRALVSGDAMLDINEARLERDVLVAVRGLAGSQPAARAPRSLASMRRATGTSTIRRALDGIPRAELSVEAFVHQPSEPLDPWRAEVLVDVRPIAGEAPDFATPTTQVEFEVRPYGEPGASIVKRWHVVQVQLDRGGLLGLSRDIVYVRRGNVGVVAPVEDAWVARDVAGKVDDLQAGVRRRYRGLSEGRAAFVALVPTRAHVSRVYDEAAMPRDAIGTAYDDRRMAILLPNYRWDPAFMQRDLLRHELTHLATSRLTRAYGYAIYAEGLAEWEGNHEVVATDSFYIDNGPAVAAVESGKVDLDAVLFEVDGFEELDDDMGYRLGMLVADYLESEYGHAKAVRFYALIGDGIEPRIAVRRVLHASPAAFRGGVRAWMGSHRSWFG
jgi:hypothetical protein